MKRALVAIAALFILGGWDHGSSVVTGWHVLNVGAGGQLEHLDIANDGTPVIGSDVGGGYVWNGTRWLQLATLTSMPSNSAFCGLWDVAIAHSDSTRIYITMVGVTYVSSNKGATFVATGFPSMAATSGCNSGDATDSNGSYKFTNEKLMVDPANHDVVYLATNNNGIQVSFNAGTSAAQVSSITPGTTGPGGAGIAFDPNSGTVTVSGQTRTAGVYVGSYGYGVWHSADGGVTWTQIATGSGGTSPLNVWTAQIGADGVYFCIETAVGVWKYQSSTWTLIQSGASWQSVATDPNKAGRIVISGPSGGKSGRESLNNGTSWVGSDTWFPTYPGVIGQIATDIPWLATSDTSFMTVGNMKMDRTQVNAGGYSKVVFAEGVGVWTTDWPQTFVAFNWTSQSLGIEEIVANDIIAPVGGGPIVAGWDRGVFTPSTSPTVFPSAYGTVNGSFFAGWALDYASSNTSFIVCACDWDATQQSGYSSNSGATWTLFTSSTPDSGLKGGAIAASTTTNFVWVAADNGVPYYTTNGGTTWAICQLASGGALPTDGWIFAYYLDSHPVAADRVTAGTFYIYNYVHGLYQSTNGGATWTLVRATLFTGGGDNQALRATPGIAGDIWYIAGSVGGGGHPASGAYLQHSTNGGTSFSAIANTGEPLAFGFGAPKPGGSGYPSIYMYGWISSVLGIWRSDDTGSTWTNLGLNPNGNLDNIKTISGDMNTWGRVYLGFEGTGYAWGQFNFLLNRDLHPASNDNTPAFLEHVA